MKTISAALKAHLAKTVTTLATCWKVTLKNGTVLGFTDHTRNLVVSGVTYHSSSGYTPTAIESSNMLAVDTLEVQAILDGGMVTEEDLLAGLWDNAAVQVFWVNYEDLSMGILIQKTGTLGQITIKGTSFLAEMRGMTQAYVNNIGDLYAPLCRAKFGDAKCKVDLTPYTKTGTVQGVDTTNRVITDSSRTEAGPTGGKAITGISRAKRAVVTCVGHGFGSGSNVFISGVVGVVRSGSSDGSTFYPGSGASINGYTYGIDVIDADHFSINLDTRNGSNDPTTGPEWSLVYSDYVSGGTATPYGDAGYFDYGLMTFNSGLNSGLSMEVKSYHPGTIELQLPMPYQVAVGDTYTIIAGCGKRVNEDCKTRYNNVVNFRGEPHLPGADQLMAVGSPPDTE
jgi:uncharacterized phage protein (TIGR02218 family)